MSNLIDLLKTSFKGASFGTLLADDAVEVLEKVLRINKKGRIKMTPQKIIDSYERYASLKAFVERHESMTAEQRANQERVEVTLDLTDEELSNITTAAEANEMTIDEFIEHAIYEYMRALLTEYETKDSADDFNDMSKAGLESLRNDTGIVENAVEMNKKD